LSQKGKALFLFLFPLGPTISSKNPFLLLEISSPKLLHILRKSYFDE
jgi:hypothetical protein